MICPLQLPTLRFAPPCPSSTLVTLLPQSLCIDCSLYPECSSAHSLMLSSSSLCSEFLSVNFRSSQSLLFFLELPPSPHPLHSSFLLAVLFFSIKRSPSKLLLALFTISLPSEWKLHEGRTFGLFCFRLCALAPRTVPDTQ